MNAAVDWAAVQAAAVESYRAVRTENGNPWDSVREAYLEGFEAGYAAAVIARAERGEGV